MRQVRAKFRCMSITHEWNGIWTVEFRPVTQRGSNKENEAFWSATPSGEAKLSFYGPAKDNRGENFTPGDYYYIDMVSDPEGGWAISSIFNHMSSSEVELAARSETTVGYTEKGLRHGKLSVGLCKGSKVLALFGAPEDRWSVEFTWAEASDD